MERWENACLCVVHFVCCQVIHMALLFVMISEFDATWKSNL